MLSYYGLEFKKILMRQFISCLKRIQNYFFFHFQLTFIKKFKKNYKILVVLANRSVIIS